ncbi:hypothetical protein HanRHA438_Chr11g0486811 [Helianthus annuus]|nr:hypothetical protein HanRHA438_Chr11g0486811 [Helianthus annuus]
MRFRCSAFLIGLVNLFDEVKKKKNICLLRNILVHEHLLNDFLFVFVCVESDENDF